MALGRKSRCCNNFGSYVLFNRRGEHVDFMGARDPLRNSHVLEAIQIADLPCCLLRGRRYAHKPFGLVLGPLMKCPKCRHENEVGAKFCEECSAPLARACAKCGRPLSPTAKFCPGCAHPVALSPEGLATTARLSSPESYTPKHLAEKIITSRTALEGERKQVTVLFADLKGSMELLADRDPEPSAKPRTSPRAWSRWRCLGRS